MPPRYSLWDTSSKSTQPGSLDPDSAEATVRQPTAFKATYTNEPSLNSRFWCARVGAGPRRGGGLAAAAVHACACMQGHVRVCCADLQVHTAYAFCVCAHHWHCRHVLVIHAELSLIG